MTSSVAIADIILEETAPQFAGRITLNMETGETQWEPADGTPRAGPANDIYRNMGAPCVANGAVSSTDLLALWGDRVMTTGTGILDEMDFTIFNSSSSAGTLLTATFGLEYYEGATQNFIDGFNTASVSFGAGLNPGFFTVITVTGLGGLNINLNTSDLFVVQTVLAKTGPATRLGIASHDPIQVGTSANSMFIAASTIGGGVPGFYTLGNPPINANPGYRINLVPEPGTLSLLACSMIALCIRRRR